ncbi:hypothetical protein LshimejAT787_1702770 [Lyophyllum shimeji]|uniref:Uncharacterized protein n=1 Tax=Lyophyllum shimeji TaxID=47721 RepID=A0A9P3UUE4_LYOSH|nr:hypothetical protein LshimejAT787_1702770 [Lyophyllum shimeji]
MAGKVVKRRGLHMRRSRSLAPATPPGSPALLHPPLLREGRFVSHQPSQNVTLELQRISYFFQGTSVISEAEFATNCKSITNIMRYSHSQDTKPRQQGLLVEVVENAVITFLIRVLPLVFHELITPTSLLHPISPPMIVSLLEVADTHVDVYGDFALQLRMAAIHQLLRDSEAFALAFSMCQTLPRVHPSPTWQPVINPVKAHPVSNVHGSISLPEITPLCSLLSSLLNCTFSSSESSLFHARTISESISQPTVSHMDKNPSTVSLSSSMPSLRCASAPAYSSTSVAPPIIAFEGHSFRIDTSPVNPLFSPPFFSPSREDYETVPFAGGNAALIDLPDIHQQGPAAEDNLASTPHGTSPYPSIISIVSQDDLSKLISCPDVGEDPPSPSLFSPPPGDHSASLDDDFAISISASDLQGDIGSTQGSKTDAAALSPIPNQTSSPLSSPPEIIVREDEDNFRNMFKLDVQKRSPSPYSKRLRSASNNLLSTMKRVMPSPRRFSASTRRQRPLDPDLAALTLPSPPRRRTFALQEADEVPTVAQKKAPRKAKAMPGQDDDVSAVPRHRWERGASGSFSRKAAEKENA